MIDWTADADALLIKLWGEGLSLSLIADGLAAAGYHVSRNAVSGRRHRLSRSAFLVREQQPTGKLRRPRPRGIIMNPRKPTATKVAEIDALSNVVGIDYFENTACKATLDRQGDWGLPLVCGQPLATHSTTYCAGHCKIFHHPHQGRRSTDGQASQVPGSRNFRQGRA